MNKKIKIFLVINTIFIFLFLLVSCNKDKADIENENIVETTSEVSNEESNTSTIIATPTIIDSKETYIVDFDTKGGSIVTSQEVQDGKKVKKPEDPIKDGYTFDGWYCKDEKWIFIGYIVTEDMTLEAKWVINSYDLTLQINDLDAGNVEGFGTYNYNEEITISATTNPGYTFVGWYKNNEYVIDKPSYTFNMPSDNVEYEARWTIYTLNTLVNDSDAGTITEYNNVKITKGESITLTATTNPGYTFIGWYKNNEYVIDTPSYTFNMPSENVEYEARFTINKYTITIDNHTEGISILGITSGDEFDYNTKISLSSLNVPELYTIKWERSDGVFWLSNNYTFNMPAENIVITITLPSPYTREDDKIYFGTYPQTLVEDENLINELNNLSNDLIITEDWTKDNYSLYYLDIDYDNNGTYDYRGVNIEKYLDPFLSYSENSQENHNYLIGTTYWFSYDPIEWDILDEDDGKVFIIANLILDSKAYYKGNNTSKFNHNGGEGYSNNYELSDIRIWLNDNFYNTAFNELQKTLIKVTLVDNSGISMGASAGNICESNNTNDKIFLLSYQEIMTYKSSDKLKMITNGTDYAYCLGLNMDFWWLRSPSKNAYFNVAQFVDMVGLFSHEQHVSGITNYLDYGVRPACWITL